MSLSSPRSESPVRKYFRVRASTGDVIHYDKSQGKEVEQDIPFNFIVLDILTTVGGFHEPSNSGIWANEVRSSTKDVLRVKNKSGLLVEGAYSEIKDRLKAVGGKFANSVYIAYRDGGELVLGNINFIGASVSAWFDFSQGKRLDSAPGVAITGFTEQKKGRTEYFVPTFEQWAVGENDLATATALDRDLQEYLASALNRIEDAVEGALRMTAPPVQESFSSQPLTATAPF